MKDKLNQTIEGILHERQTRRRYAAILLVLALITVLSVNWSLHQKGLSLTADAYAQETVDATAETALDADDAQENTDAAAQAAPATLQLDDAQYAIAVQADDPINMTGADHDHYVTGLSGDGTKYDAEKNMYSTNLGMDFKFPAGTVTSDSLHYYYDYPAGIIVPSNLLDTDHSLLDASGAKAGTYKFVKNSDGTYRVYVDFDEKYANEHSNSAISGNISFQGHASASSGDEDGNIHLVGKDGVTLDIPKDKIEYPDNSTNLYDITTNKSGSYSVKDGKLTYTVTVDSVKGTPGDVEFTDKINANGLTLGTPQVTVAKKTITRYYYGTEGNYNYDAPKDAGTVTVNPAYDNGKLTMTLPKMDTVISAPDNEGRYNMTYTRYEITYTYDVSNLPAGTTTTVNNNVTTASTNNTTEIKSTAKADVTVSNKYEVEKIGTPNIGQGFIVWQIKVNPNGLDIAGAKLTDDMLQNLLVNDKGEEEFTIDPKTGYTIHKDGGKITDITFNAVNGDTNNNTYTIRYRTPVQGNWNGTANVTNKAHLTDKDGGKLADGEATVEIKEGSLVSKTAAGATESEDGNTVAVNWKVKVTAPLDGIPAGVTITDTLTTDAGEKAPHYRTRQQAIDWAKNIYWVDARGNKVNGNVSLTDGNIADVKFTASDGNTYTWQQINGDTTLDSLTFTDCKVTLNAKLQPPEGAAYLVFDYYTTANVKDAPAGSNTFYNHFDIGGKTATAYYEYKKDGITKTDENGDTGETSKTNEDGTLIWKINANLSKATDSLEITDDLPEGVTLVSVSGENGISQLGTLTPDDTTGALTGTAGSYKVSGSYTDNELSLTIQHKDGGQLNAGTYTLVVTCQVDKENINGYVAGKTYTFTNTATAKINNSSISSASQTQKWTEDTDHSTAKIVDKTGAWDNSTRRFKYSIKLNPYGKDLVEGSDVLELTDEFKYYSKFSAYYSNSANYDKDYNATAWLVPNTVKLYKAKMVDGELVKDTEITNWTWTVTTRDNSQLPGGKICTLTGKDLPDSTPMILEYEYQMQTDMPEGRYATMQVSNEASLKDVADKGTYIPSNVQWSDQQTSGSVTSDAQGILYKVAKGNYGKLLPGAVFTLQKYEDGSYKDTDTIYTTDADGKIVIQWQKTASDVQYEQNTLYRVVETTPPKGYKLPSNAVSKAFYFYFSENDAFTVPSAWPTAIDLRKESTVVYVENESAALTINKTWLDSAGNADATHTSGSVQVDVYRLATTSPSTGEMASLSGKIVSTADWGRQDWETIEAQDYPVGTEISLVITRNIWVAGAPEIKVNGTVCTPDIKEIDANYSSYTYTFTLTTGDNVVSGTIPYHGENTLKITAKTPDTSTGGDSGSSQPTGGEKFRTYTITAADNWTLTITDLPATGTDANGNTVYYTYYVQEVNPGNYTPGYENNGGISSGTITITNRASDSPSYELPSTGGPGTTLFTTGGLALMGIALLYGYWEIRKKKREVKHPL